MTALYQALARLEHADLSHDDRTRLQPAFAALHGAEAIALPVDLIDRIRALDAQMSEPSRTASDAMQLGGPLV